MRLNLCCDIEGTDEDLTDQLNVDLIISLDPVSKKYILMGKSSNLLLIKLKQLTKDHPRIEVRMLKGGQSYD